MIQQEGTTLKVVAGPEAAELVRKAQPKNSPYHSLFTWDDAEAARLYRLAEAEWWVKAWKESEEHGDGSPELDSLTLKVGGVRGRHGKSTRPL